MAAIQAKYHISNRSVKRPADREVLRVWAEIETIETNFEQALFYADSSISYRQLYELYLREWLQIVEKLKTYSLKYIKINVHHFADQYKPLEYL